MRPGRFSIRGMMSAVAVVALNIAVLRLIFISHHTSLLGLILGWVVLQVGGQRALCRRGGARAYWSGFVAADSVALLTLLIGVWFPFSWPGSAWRGYFSAVADPLNRLTFALVGSQEPSLAIGVALELGAASVLALALFLPQLVVATIGGALARLLSETIARKRRTPIVPAA